MTVKLIRILLEDVIFYDRFHSKKKKKVVFVTRLFFFIIIHDVWRNPFSEFCITI